MESQPRQRPTLKDVARQAGVSHMTVSRVVRGSDQVSREKCARVRKAITALGYSPDPAMTALAAYRSSRMNHAERGTLAFISLEQTEYSQRVIEGARSEAAYHGYQVDAFNLSPTEVGIRTLSRQLYHRGIRGLMFGPSKEAWHLQKWPWEHYASVSLGVLAHHPPIHAVAMNYFSTAFEAVTQLKASGCKRIGFAIQPRLEARTGHQWLGGYLAALDGQAPLHYQKKWPAKRVFADWCRAHAVDGLLTIHTGLVQWWPLETESIRLLNDNHAAIPGGATYLSLSPQTIGLEGVRFLHHLLLRREFGLPTEAKSVLLKGRWKVAADNEKAQAIGPAL